MDGNRTRSIYTAQLDHPRRVGKWVFFRSVIIEMQEWLDALGDYRFPIEEGARPSINECLRRIDLVVEEQNAVNKRRQAETLEQALAEAKQSDEKLRQQKG